MPAPTPSSPTPPSAGLVQRHSPQSTRLRRFAMAAATYLLGLGMLGACAAVGLFPWPALGVVAAAFALINAGFYLALRSGFNQRFADPSLTAAQVCAGASLVPIILVLGRDVLFVAAPFYSVVFVFGMLQMSPRMLAGTAVYAVASFCAAVAWRSHVYGATLDLRVEAITALLVVGSTAWFAAAAAHISRLRSRLRATLAQIEGLATRDPLTGLWNRRQFDADLEAAVRQADRQGAALCVAMVDVDHFKSVNDRFGHAAGDEVLKAVAGTLEGCLRAGDRVARYGGEEFVLLLPATTMAQATALAERLRQRLQALQSLPAGEGAVTASLGLAAWRAGESAGELVRRADQALYRAKAGGRNRVEADALFRVMA